MSFHHRIPALVIATLATIASGLCFLSGFSCEFLEVNAEAGSLLLSSEEEEFMAITTTIGVICANEFYDRDDDRMWKLSFIFQLISLGLGALAVVLAWAVSTILPPTIFTWKLLSVFTAMSAIFQVPIFLVMEASPCSDHRDTQSCELSLGSYFLMGSTVIWIAVTFCTQCLDPPLWAIAISEWRVPKPEHSPAPTGNDTEPDLIFESKTEKRSFWSKKPKASDMGLPAVQTASTEDLDERHVDGIVEDRIFTPSRRQGKAASQAANGDIDARLDRAEQGWSADQKKGKVSYYLSSSPSKATERVRVVASASALDTPDDQSNMLSSMDILEDLENPGTQTLLGGNKSNGAVRNSSDDIVEDKYNKGIREITTKLKKDSNRRKNLWQSRRRGGYGYAHMSDDDGDDSDFDTFMSPPIEVEIKPFANFDDVDFSQMDLSDDEKADLMDGWNELHKATANGARLGLQEGYLEDGEAFDFNALPPFKSGGGYHSDPEPAVDTSDESSKRKSLSRMRNNPTIIEQEDNSTLSSHEQGQQANNNVHRPRRAANSPSRSIKSGAASLIALTINEETDQDILEESSIGEDDYGITYSLHRTISAPDLGVKTHVKHPVRRVRRSDEAATMYTKKISEKVEYFRQNPSEFKPIVSASEELSDTASGSSPVAGSRRPLSPEGLTPTRSYKSLPTRPRARLNFDYHSLSPSRKPTYMKDGYSSPTKSVDDTVPESGTVSPEIEDPPSITRSHRSLPSRPRTGMTFQPRSLSPNQKLAPSQPMAYSSPPKPPRTPPSETSPQIFRARSPAHSARAIPPRPNQRIQFQSRSLSPTRRNVRVPKNRSDAVSLGGAYARHMPSDDDSSSQSSNTNLSKRARAFRIRRMQRMQESASTPLKSQVPSLRDTYVPPKPSQRQVASYPAVQNTYAPPKPSQRPEASYPTAHNTYVPPKPSQRPEAYYRYSRQLHSQDSDDSPSKGRLSVETENSLDPDDSYYDDRQEAYQDIHRETLYDQPCVTPSPKESDVFSDDATPKAAGGEHEAEDEFRPLPPKTPPAIQTVRSEDECHSQLSIFTGNSNDLPMDAHAVVTGFTEPQTPGRESMASLNEIMDDEEDDEDLELKYGNSVMDQLDLELVELRRPMGLEYGGDEVSL